MLGNIHLLAGDCLQWLPKFPEGKIDFVISDLPYGQTQNSWDTVIPIEPLFAELHRVTKPNAAIVLLAAQPFASRLICTNERNFRYDLIWIKNKPTGFLNAKRQPLRQHEHILVFYRKPPFYSPQMTVGHEPGHRAVRAKRSSNYGDYKSTEYGGSTERYPTSVLPIPVINNDDPDKFHPTQKPVALIEWLINSYSAPGELVLDVASGVGTTGIAARNLGRRAICIELNPAYVEIAQRRLYPALQEAAE